MTHWDAAVEAGARASFAEHNNGESLDILRPLDRKAWKHEAEVALSAAAPSLERHFRALFEAELAKRQEKR